MPLTYRTKANLTIVIDNGESAKHSVVVESGPGG
jgi:hypothetical protein